DRHHVNPLARGEAFLEIRAGTFPAGRIPDVRRDAVRSRRRGAVLSLAAVESETPLQLTGFSLAEPVHVGVFLLPRAIEAVRPQPRLHGQPLLQVHTESAVDGNFDVGAAVQSDGTVGVVRDGPRLVETRAAVVNALALVSGAVECRRPPGLVETPVPDG